ncbi:hypothetical protein FOFC_20759 [Fusarium oxysporum]|nr:hypothetical protein FOFC_20759 [Fusarium oxysporum]
MSSGKMPRMWSGQPGLQKSVVREVEGAEPGLSKAREAGMSGSSRKPPNDCAPSKTRPVAKPPPQTYLRKNKWNLGVATSLIATWVVPLLGMLSSSHISTTDADPEIARTAARESLPYEEDSLDEEPRQEHLAADALRAASLATEPPALAASVPKMIPDISIPTGQLSIHDEPPINSVSAPGYISGNRATSPPIPSANGPLSRRFIMGFAHQHASLRILSHLFVHFLVELRDLRPERPTEQDMGRVPPGPSSTFPTSPAGNLGYRFSLTTNLPSHPSPSDGYRTLSPHSATVTSRHYEPTNGAHPHAPTEDSSSNAGETPNTDHSTSTPATSPSINSTSITDRMSIDGITHPQPVLGSYTCTANGCNAAPFRTQHVRVHHIDKYKDDPQLRDVLAQRPGGHNRGRRRRGPPS